jgi:hypothetical protein
MGPKITRFVIDGAVKELAYLERKQAHEESRLRQQMYRRNHIPVLDITPLVEHVYVPVTESFRYTITMYGVEVEGDVWDYEGWLNGELVRATSGTKFARLSKASGLM